MYGRTARERCRVEFEMLPLVANVQRSRAVASGTDARPSAFRMWWHRLVPGLLVAGAIVLPGAASAQSGIRSGPPPNVSADLQMAQDAAPYRQVADRFIERAMDGDMPALSSMLSRKLVERSGEDTLREALDRSIVPFFRWGRRTGPALTVTRTSDAGGQQGYAFYMWLESSSAEAPRPFTLYVVDEGGRPMVANIVPDRRVDGRHP